MWTDDWKRNLAALWTGQVLLMVAFYFFFPFMPLYIQTLDVHGAAAVARWSGLISAVPSISLIIAQPIWGRLSDRFGRKPMVLRSMGAMAVLAFLMGRVHTVHQLLALRFVQGAVTGTVAAATALVATSMPRHRLGFALGAMQGSIFLGSCVGPLLGGPLADAYGYRAAFSVSAVLMALGTVVVALGVREDFTPAASSGPRPGVLAEGRRLLAVPLFPLLMGVIFLIQFGNNTAAPVLTLYIEGLHAGRGAATVAGLVLGATGAVSAVAALAIGRAGDRVGTARVLPVCLLGVACCVVPQALVGRVWELAVLRVAMGAFLGGLMPSANAMVAALVRREDRGAAFGLTSSATALSNVLGPVFGAGVASTLGMRWVFGATALVFVAAFLASVAGLRRHGAPARSEGPDEAPAPVSDEGLG